MTAAAALRRVRGVVAALALASPLWAPPAAAQTGAAQTGAAGDPAAGRRKAEALCKVCHGLDGLARMDEAPHIAGEHAAYLANQLKAFRSGRRFHTIMSVIAAEMNDEDIADVAAWYASIRITVEMPD